MDRNFPGLSRFDRWPEQWRFGLDAGLKAAFPPSCAFCRRVCEQNPIFPGICKSCLPSLPFRSGRQAGLPWREAAAIAASAVSAIYCATWYKDPVRQALLRFKFSDAPELATALAAILLQSYRQNGLDCLAVAAIPLHPSRLRERGYNQAGLLAAKLAQEVDRPDWSGRIIRTRVTERQSSQTDRAVRQMNLAGAFSLAADFQQPDIGRPARPIGQSVLLIDDILTTGATLTEAARPFWQNGLSVTGLVVASDHKPCQIVG
jgi:ComF family protein